VEDVREITPPNVQEIKITLLITNVHKFVVFPMWKIANGLPIYILIALTMTMNNSKNQW